MSRKLTCLMHVEIVVADVAAADDRDRVVHDEQFVVHAVVDATEVGEETQQLPRSIGERIEDADFDVGVRIHRRDEHVAVALEVQIVDQDAYPDTSIRGAHEVLDQDPPGGILIPDEVLQIQRLFRQLGHCNARRKRAASVREYCEPRLARTIYGSPFEVRPDRGVRVVRETRRTVCGGNPSARWHSR